jgi:hypothetical protein
LSVAADLQLPTYEDVVEIILPRQIGEEGKLLGKALDWGAKYREFKSAKPENRYWRRMRMWLRFIQ